MVILTSEFDDAHVDIIHGTSNTKGTRSDVRTKTAQEKAMEQHLLDAVKESEIALKAQQESLAWAKVVEHEVPKEFYMLPSTMMKYQKWLEEVKQERGIN